ncbi:uncharacterized protein CLUP02_08046 [Colletotrichum lupini]|uniref:Uncharacterized protein n=1 Tax=Colletotrichum lupini TaxID=145971 RepID=A0A9Q8SS45_9PEZI|nr:uncharacterized protein CLUP02_08046 [Colletotrichum lupini]UQC82557.1 hypothetical protein CLUP02_08046 [Colletotrichum lupini]
MVAISVIFKFALHFTEQLLSFIYVTLYTLYMRISIQGTNATAERSREEEQDVCPMWLREYWQAAYGGHPRQHDITLAEARTQSPSCSALCHPFVPRMIGMRKAACGMCRLGFSTVRLNPGMQLYLRYLTMISGRQELGLRKRAVSADTYTTRVPRVSKERGKTTGADDGVFVTSINLHLHVQRNLV